MNISTLFEKKHFLIIFSLFIVIIVRAPFLPGNIDFNNDAYIYSNNIEKNFFDGTYDVQLPGYVSYIYTGKIIHFFVRNPVATQHIINIILVILITLFLFELMQSFGFRHHESFIFGIIFSFNNVYLLGSLTGGNRLFLIISSIVLITLSMKILIEKKNNYIILFSIFFAFFIGFRQDISFDYIPLYVYLFFRIKNFRLTAISILLFIMINLSWFIPLMAEYGGISSYSKHLANSSAVYETSIIFSGFKLSPIINILRVFIYVFNSFLLVFPFFMYSLIKKEFHISRDILSILAFSFLPAFLFQLLVHNGNFVHLASFMVPLFLFLIMNFKINSARRMILLIIVPIILLFQFYGLRMFDTKIPETASEKFFEERILNGLKNNEDKGFLLKFYIKSNDRYVLDKKRLDNSVENDRKKFDYIFYSVKYKLYEKIINVLILQYTYDGVKTGNTLRLRSILPD